MTEIPTDIKKLSFEDSYKNLEEILALIESGDSSLEKSIELYELGIKLKNHCEEKLKTAELKIKKVINKNELEKFD